MRIWGWPRHYHASVTKQVDSSRSPDFGATNCHEETLRQYLHMQTANTNYARHQWKPYIYGDVSHFISLSPRVSVLAPAPAPRSQEAVFAPAQWSPGTCGLEAGCRQAGQTGHSDPRGVLWHCELWQGAREMCKVMIRIHVSCHRVKSGLLKSKYLPGSIKQSDYRSVSWQAEIHKMLHSPQSVCVFIKIYLYATWKRHEQAL